MTAKADDPGFRNPKCYVNKHGGCSKRISGEHYISHSLIKLYGFDDPDIKVKHDNGYGIREFVSPKKFVANVLCVNHNTALEPADAAALKVAKFLFKISTEFRCGSGEWGEPETIDVSGDDFQRWVLKLLLNHVVGKAFTHQKGEFVSPYADEAVDLLLDRGMWPRTWGMCVGGDSTNEDLMINRFDNFDDITKHATSFQPLIFHPHVPGKANEVGGGIVNLNGVGFALTLFNAGHDNADDFNTPKNFLRGSIQRPLSIAWDVGGVQKRIQFTWSDYWEHKTITYKLKHPT